jgi:hypothetical protein
VYDETLVKLDIECCVCGDVATAIVSWCGYIRIFPGLTASFLKASTIVTYIGTALRTEQYFSRETESIFVARWNTNREL